MSYKANSNLPHYYLLISFLNDVLLNKYLLVFRIIELLIEFMLTTVAVLEIKVILYKQDVQIYFI